MAEADEIDRAYKTLAGLAVQYGASLIPVGAVAESTGHFDQAGRPVHAVVVEVIASTHADGTRMSSRLGLVQGGTSMIRNTEFVRWTGWLSTVRGPRPAAVRIYVPATIQAAGT
ncbi:hypothetical protein GCM10027059_21180 [Myceligenerans halotolerans]